MDESVDKKISITSYDTSPGGDLIFRDATVHAGPVEILHEVSGKAEKGEIFAVMGPSGAGKTTLLNSLAGRMPLTSGEITLNGQPLNKKMKRKICYVLQQDVFFAKLTLRQTLLFTAMLRLPDKMKHSEKLKRIYEIVDNLELNKCLDTLVGGLSVPGLSGGEKKRANIACELLTNPMLMLLDEPTSGLDSVIAFKLMTTLKKYARIFKKTVVTSIHQPSSSMFHMFDKLLLISNGRVAYFGPGSKVLEFFSSMGLICPPHYNPADFIMEKLRESKDLEDEIIEAQYLRRQSEEWPIQLRASSVSKITTKASSQQINENNGHKGSLPLDKMDIIFHDGVKGINYIKKDPDSHVVNIERCVSVAEDTLGRLYDEEKKWPTGFWKQYTTLTRRDLINSRSAIISKLHLIQTFFLAFLIGLIWFRLPRTEETLRDRMGLIFFLSQYWSFVCFLDTLKSFPGERPVIMKERASGAYRLSAYYLAKITSQLPLTIIQPICFYAIVYWMTNLNPDVLVYCTSLATILLGALFAQSAGLCISAAIADTGTVMTVGTIYLLASILAGGFFQRHISWYFVWLQYMSFFYYIFHALMMLEFSTGSPLTCLSANKTAFPICTSGSGNETMTIPGPMVLEFHGITKPIWVYYAVLLVTFLLLYYFGYLALRFIGLKVGSPRGGVPPKTKQDKKQDN